MGEARRRAQAQERENGVVAFVGANARMILADTGNLEVAGVKLMKAAPATDGEYLFQNPFSRKVVAVEGGRGKG